MFCFQSNNNFLSSALINFFQQKDIQVTADKEKPIFACLFFLQNDSNLTCNLNNQSFNLTLPQHSHILFTSVMEILKKVNIQYQEMSYFPVLQQVNSNSRSIKIKNIHNIIFSNLLLNLNGGINKYDLYKLIWPFDKDIQINKLDTHLTNLKSEIKSELNFNLEFSSASGTLKLAVY